MERILELAGKAAQEAEVFEYTTEETQVRFESNRLKQMQTNQTTSVALRVVKDGRIGYATSTDKEDAEALVRNAVETAEFGMKAEFSFPNAREFPAVDIYDDAVNNVSMISMVNLGKKMIDRVTGHTEGIICDAGVSKAVLNVRVANTRGGEGSYKKSYFSMDVEGTLIEGTDMLFVGEGDSSCQPLSDTDKITDKVLEQLDRAARKAKSPSKQLPVIFTPNGVISLMMPLMSACNGKTVLEGASPLGDKIGQTMFDPAFTLLDNPLLAYRPGSRPYDDEGVPSQVTPLVENGVVKGFLYDLQTAARAGRVSTGSGNRGRGSLPNPSPGALVISPGSMTFADMVKDIKEGLIVEQLMGAEQGNILGGDFAGNVLLGYKIEKGEIVGRVKDTVVAGNVYHILKDIAAIGSESEWVSSLLNTPPIYCKALSVASKG